MIVGVEHGACLGEEVGVLPELGEEDGVARFRRGLECVGDGVAELRPTGRLRLIGWRFGHGEDEKQSTP